MRIEHGETYVNGRGDICGPMEERTPGVFLDQHGAVYHPDGKEWNHLEGSTANLLTEHYDPWLILTKALVEHDDRKMLEDNYREPKWVTKARKAIVERLLESFPQDAGREATIEAFAKSLEDRALGFERRRHVIFNGQIIANELNQQASRLRALSRNGPGR